jgi:hypothetical protein
MPEQRDSLAAKAVPLPCQRLTFWSHPALIRSGGRGSLCFLWGQATAQPSVFGCFSYMAYGDLTLSTTLCCDLDLKCAPVVIGYRFDLQLMALWGGGGAFRRWGLVGGSRWWRHVLEGDSRALPLLFLFPNHQEVSSLAQPCWSRHPSCAACLATGPQTMNRANTGWHCESK